MIFKQNFFYTIVLALGCSFFSEVIVRASAELDVLVQYDCSSSKVAKQVEFEVQGLAAELGQESYFNTMLCDGASSNQCSYELFKIIVARACSNGWSLDGKSNNPEHIVGALAPIHRACKKGLDDKVQCLLKKGAHPNLLDHQGKTILDYYLHNRNYLMIDHIQSYKGQSSQEQATWIMNEMRRCNDINSYKGGYKKRWVPFFLKK
jgi:hypothetical protein